MRGIHRSPGEFPSQRPVTRSFGVFFNMWLNKRLSKQSRLRWFEALSRSLWRHGNEYQHYWCPYDTDALSLCVARPSAVMVLNVYRPWGRISSTCTICGSRYDRSYQYIYIYIYYIYVCVCVFPQNNTAHTGLWRQGPKSTRIHRLPVL